jgi:hypothetical protein
MAKTKKSTRRKASTAHAPEELVVVIVRVPFKLRQRLKRHCAKVGRSVQEFLHGFIERSTAATK